MAFNPYTYVNNIYNLKGQWDKANNAGDITARDDAAKKAQEYYQALRDNNYGSVADELQKSNYAQAKTINDKWAKMGKTATRDYLYSLGKSRGMTSNDIDSLIGWDNDTGEVTFGGKKIGKPDAAVNGVSYWSDTSILDNAFNDYITRTGTTRSPEIAVNQENEGLFSKYNDAYDYIMNTNPFTTEEAKAIIGKYDLAGLNARDNAVANGGASNGGNIDSYAAANAMRQQASLVNQGQMAVLDAHKQKIDNIRGILSDMGVNIDRVYNQDQTAKNNEVARMGEQASVTGYVPNEWTIKNDDTYSQFLNADGSFKKEMEGIDIQALIDQAKARGETDVANKLAVVRGRKILGNYAKFGQYSKQGDISFMTPQKTAEYDTNLKGIESAEKIAKDSNETSLSIVDKEADLKKTIANIEASTTLSVAEKEAAIALAQLQAAASEGDYAAGELNGFLSTWETKDTGPRNFITNVLWKDFINNGVTPTEQDLISLIVNNTDKYNIDVADAKSICNFFGYSTKWLDNYVDRNSADDIIDDETGKVTKQGIHRGMKPIN